ncbi:TIR domain-containing protein [Fructilactobacillus cliffordii]|uniref:TIR domain-containing protein n=1 Tax=Fructilactobacillus cliffordii TaxID=2940299 RepID=A0A9Q8ZTX5_9LACO|nr:TIR domain-containing protein [Fructilactobacillus cliffordii]USS89253.1 TIR domain-containing protein [Fructilactobacillus cliffordii]
MVYRNKVYVAFDGDEDIRYYDIMKAWNKNQNHNFEFNNAHELHQARDSSTEESIKISLKDRLNNSKAFILLLGKNTRFLYKFVRWEIEMALKLEIPIIVVNLNGSKGVDYNLLPPILRNESFSTVPFKESDIIEELRKI